MLDSGQNQCFVVVVKKNQTLKVGFPDIINLTLHFPETTEFWCVISLKLSRTPLWVGWSNWSSIAV